jgi:hypothetical protein
MFYACGKKSEYFFLLFIFSAILGLAWMILFQIFATDSPRHNRFVSDHERRYIAMEVNKYLFDSKKVEVNQFANNCAGGQCAHSVAGDAQLVCRLGHGRRSFHIRFTRFGHQLIFAHIFQVNSQS